MMTPTTFSNHTGKSLSVSMGNLQSIIAPTTHAPSKDLLCINPALLMYLIQNTASQPIRRVRIIRISRTVACSWNLYPDRGKAVCDVVSGGTGMLGAIAVETVNRHYNRKLLSWLGSEGKSDADGYGDIHLFRAGFGVAMRNEIFS